MAKAQPPFSDEQINRVTNLRMKFQELHGTHAPQGVDDIVDLMNEHGDDDDAVLAAMGPGPEREST